MARLIDLNKIPHKAFCGDRDDLVDALFAAPTVDAVEVVRCKDCSWWLHNMGGDDEYLDLFAVNGNEVCPYAADNPWYNKEPDPNGYCHLGERGD